MARTTSFTKRTLIGKANNSMVMATTIAAFILVFTLVGGKALISQVGYQGRVIDAKKKALTQLKADLDARDSLEESYKDFVKRSPNVLGGETEGATEKDGDNAKIVLDALPSKYDFPALTTSLEKLIVGQNLTIVGISGTDEEVTQKSKETSTDPVAITMPFEVRVNGSYQSVQNLIDVFSRSIRPFQIQNIEISGDETSMNASITAQTFYQPEKSLNIKTEVVK